MKRYAAALCLALAIAGTASPGSAATLKSIDHIVIIVQENRSFDDLFLGFPGAHSVTVGKTPGGGTTPLQPISLAAPYDISHGFQDAMTAYDGGAMDGFANEYANGGRTGYPQYGYVPQREVAPYWNLAAQYVLADDMFSSQLDGSFVAHQYLIAAYAGNTYNLPSTVPWGCDAPGTATVNLLNATGLPDGVEFPCFDYPTIADRLDAAAVSWRVYAPQSGLGSSWNGFDAINQIRNGPDWKHDIITPETAVLKAAHNGQLPAVAWVIPTDALSDHAGSRSKRGPSWVASIVNAIGNGPQWNSTVVFVTWDDWGGWYDDVSPPRIDADGLGFRVPLLCISPYARAGYVDHTRYEFSSLLRLIEQRFAVPSLHRRDAHANAPTNCFNFAQQPRVFHTISAPYNERDVILHAGSQPPDTQ